MISSKDARARRDAAAADELCCIFSNEWVEEFKVVLFYKYVYMYNACRKARLPVGACLNEKEGEARRGF